MRSLPRWLVWRLQRMGDRWSKVPHNPITHQLASPTNPQTWGAFEDAAGAYHSRYPLYAGVGFVLASDGFVALDLDDCVDPTNGILDNRARAIVRALNSHTELSPSGCGVRAFVRGTLPPGRRRHAGVELYDSGRYMTVTGRVLRFHDDNQLPERTPELARIHTTYLQDPNQASDDRKPVIALHGTVTTQKALAALYTSRSQSHARAYSYYASGDPVEYGSDDSRAEYALCLALARLGCDEQLIDQIVRSSAAYIQERYVKWNSPRGTTTYGTLTIRNAINHARSTP